MGISAGIPGRVGLIYFLKRKKSRLKSTNSQKIKTTLPIMVRYPFDVLRAVSQVEPLTMIGNAVRPEVYPPDLWWVYPPSAAPASQRLVKGDQGIGGPTASNGPFYDLVKITSSYI
jgi:hypothetical protein